MVRYAELIGTSLGELYNSAGWPAFAEYLAALAAATDIAAAAAGSSADLAAYPNYVEGFPGVTCSDSVNPNEHRFWARAGARADAQYGYFGRLWTWVTSPCATWPGLDSDRYVGPFTRHTGSRRKPTRSSGSVAFLATDARTSGPDRISPPATW